MKRLVLLRHGQTTWNAERRIQGHKDAPLTDLGRAQAQAAAPAMRAYDPAVVWASDLIRAADTAAIVGERCGLVPRVDPRLREKSFGEREGITHADYLAQYPEEYERVFVHGEWDAPPGSEVWSAVAERMVAAITDMLDEIAEGETAVLVSHGGSTRIATVALLGWPLERNGDLIHLGNCAWTELARDGDRWRLAAYNRTADQ